MKPCLAGFNGGSTFENCFHESLHSSVPRVAVNYTRCLLCGGEMLRDSVSQVCPRSLCKAVRMAMQKEAVLPHLEKEI